MLYRWIIMVIPVLFVSAACPPFSQSASRIINDAFDKRIKLNFLRFFFRAPGGASVSKEGIAFPCFVIQVVGYILCFVLTIINVVFAFCFESRFGLIVNITIVIVFVELVFLALFNFVLSKISDKRDKSH